MVKQSFVVTRHNVAFVESFKEKKPSPEFHTVGITWQGPWTEKMLQPKFTILITFAWPTVCHQAYCWLTIEPSTAQPVIFTRKWWRYCRLVRSDDEEIENVLKQGLEVVQKWSVPFFNEANYILNELTKCIKQILNLKKWVIIHPEGQQEMKYKIQDQRYPSWVCAPTTSHITMHLVLTITAETNTRMLWIGCLELGAW